MRRVLQTDAFGGLVILACAALTAAALVFRPTGGAAAAPVPLMAPAPAAQAPARPTPAAAPVPARRAATMADRAVAEVAAGPRTRVLRFRVTAYCPCRKCCGKYADGKTASGAPAFGKLLAAARGIPFGTWIHVPGYGWAQVKDRGRAITGGRLDVLFPTHAQARRWGVRYLDCHVLVP